MKSNGWCGKKGKDRNGRRKVSVVDKSIKQRRRRKGGESGGDVWFGDGGAERMKTGGGGDEDVALVPDALETKPD